MKALLTCVALAALTACGSVDEGTGPDITTRYTLTSVNGVALPASAPDGKYITFGYIEMTIKSGATFGHIERHTVWRATSTDVQTQETVDVGAYFIDSQNFIQANLNEGADISARLSNGTITDDTNRADVRIYRRP